MPQVSPEPPRSPTRESPEITWGDPFDVYGLSITPVEDTALMDSFPPQSIGLITDGDYEAFAVANERAQLRIPTEFAQFFGQYQTDGWVLDADRCELALRLLTDDDQYDPRRFTLHELDRDRGFILSGEEGGVFIAPMRKSNLEKLDA